MSNNLEDGIAKAGIVHAQKHLFLCIGPDCCNPADGELVWDYIKKRVKETGLRAMRTKALCFRICTGGPHLVVYPDGTWYSQVTAARFERILQEHLLGGQPVREWLVACNSLHCVASRQRLTSAPLPQGDQDEKVTGGDQDAGERDQHGQN